MNFCFVKIYTGKWKLTDTIGCFIWTWIKYIRAYIQMLWKTRFKNIRKFNFLWKLLPTDLETDVFVWESSQNFDCGDNIKISYVSSYFGH